MKFDLSFPTLFRVHWLRVLFFCGEFDGEFGAFAFLAHVVVLRPGFGPGSSARKAGILDRTILPERFKRGSIMQVFFQSNKPYPSLFRKLGGLSGFTLLGFKQKLGDLPNQLLLTFHRLLEVLNLLFNIV